ncbi:MAG: AAA family ATPase, partial [Syntrophales bacterium]
MHYTYFKISNFKGIEDARLDVSRTPKSRVCALVGLNESGKTTVLDAINLFTYRENLLALDLPGYSLQDVHDLIPISKRSNFSGSIRIEAGIELDDGDRDEIRKNLKKRSSISLTHLDKKFCIRQTYDFK